MFLKVLFLLAAIGVQAVFAAKHSVAVLPSDGEGVFNASPQKVVIADAKAYYDRGVEYAKKGDYDKAIADYESALRIDPEDSDARESLENLKRKER